MANTIALYHADHPNITVKIVDQDSDSLSLNFTTAAATQSGPDIASLFTGAMTYEAIWAGNISPIADLLPASEIQHWLSTNENIYDNKVWVMPMFHYSYVVAYNKDLLAQAGVTPPTGSDRMTWDEFIGACDKLRAAGITPLGGGNKEGWIGSEMFTFLGLQNDASITDLLNTVVGNNSFTDPKNTAWLAKAEDLVTHKCYNDDVLSLPFDSGVSLLGQGKVAMQFGDASPIESWMQALGDDKLGVMLLPKWGTGKMADTGVSTASVNWFVTSWSKHKQEAADFLQFLHTPDQMNAFYEETGMSIADDRWDSSMVKNPVMQQQAAWMASGVPQYWAENWIPVQLDNEATRVASQMLMQGAPVATVAAAWETAAKQWRTQHPDQLEQWKKLLASLGG